MLIESWSGRFAFVVCGFLLLVMGVWGIVRPHDIPLNLIDPSSFPVADMVNQACTVVLCLCFLGAGGLMWWTVFASIRISRHTVNDTPRDPLTVNGVLLRILLVLGIFLAMFLGSLLLDYWLHR